MSMPSARHASNGVAVVHGRGDASGGMMTMGCSGLGCATALCFAEERGFPCSLCIRAGAFPAPGWWNDQRAEIVRLKRPSVQVVATWGGALKWAVVVILEDRFVDGRYPAIGTCDANVAVELAIARGAQLRPKARIERVERGRWEAAGLPIICDGVIAHAAKWRDAK